MDDMEKMRAEFDLARQQADRAWTVKLSAIVAERDSARKAEGRALAKIAFIDALAEVGANAAGLHFLVPVAADQIDVEVDVTGKHVFYVLNDDRQRTPATLVDLAQKLRAQTPSLFSR